MKQKNLILMVVAVGCGLAAAFLTARMNAGPAQVEKVEVIVPNKDITVGTMLTKEDVAKNFTRKPMAKDALPPGIIETEEELIDKRLGRNYAAGEPIKREDLKKGGVTIPPGMQMIAQSFSLPAAVAGFVTPGARVDILGTVRLGNRVRSFPILVNMLVLAVDAHTQLPKEQATYANLGTVSFAVDQKQALVMELAKARSCNMTLLLRNPSDPVNDNDKKYDIEKVIALLQDNQHPNEVVPSESGEGATARSRQDKPETIKPDPELADTPKVEVVTVWVATENIPANTLITKDLIAEKFRAKEFRAGDVEEALEPKQVEGKTLVHGLAKGQWVTGSSVGDPTLKGVPRDGFAPAKGDPNSVIPAAKRKTHDVAVHTTSGTRVYRYEEVRPGQWRLLGEVAPNARSSDDEPAPKSNQNQRID